MPSSVRSSPFSSRITRPRENMSTRSHRPASSIRVGGIDDESHALIRLGADGPIDVEAGVGVNTLGRFVNQQNFGSEHETSGQRGLLLIAARQAPDRLIEIRGDDIELIGKRIGRGLFRSRRDQSAGRKLPKHLNRDVFPHAERRKDRLARAVGANGKDAGPERDARGCSRHALALAPDRSARFDKAAERAQRLPLSIALGARES
jgi:hypothetical protein